MELAHGKEMNWKGETPPTMEEHVAAAKERLAKAEAAYRKAERRYVAAVEKGSLHGAEAANKVRMAAGDALHEARVNAACVVKQCGGGAQGRRQPVPGPSERGYRYEPR